MATAEELKAQGNAHLQAERFDEAIEAYGAALAAAEAGDGEAKPHIYYSNRSAAYLKKGDADAALRDAESCIDVSPAGWVKGWSRKGAALHALRRYPDAVEAYEAGLSAAPGDAGCTSGLQEVRKIMQQQQQQSQAGASPFGQGGLFGPEMLAKLAGHPKFGPKLGDPEFMNKLKMVGSNPQMLATMMNDPEIRELMSVLLGVDLDAAAADGPGAPGGPPGAASSTASAATSGKQAEPEPEERPETPEEDLTEEEREERQKRREALEHKQRGNDHYKAREFEEALAAYDEALALQPTAVPFMNNKAAVFFEMREYDRCIETCTEAIETGKANRANFADIAKSFVRMGKAYQKQGDLDKAIESLEKAQVEDYTKVVERLIRSLQLEQRKAAAAAYINPELAQEAKERGNEFFRNGQFQEAVPHYEEAAKRDPNNAPIQNNLAAALVKVMDFAGAQRACERALELDPQYVKAWAKKGDIEFFMKEYHKALESYQAGLAVEESNQLCLQGLQRTRAKINENMGQADEERARHAMADPEIQAILQDPMVSQVLRDMNENQESAMKAMNDPVMMGKLNKLIAAGVLQVGGQQSAAAPGR